MISWHHHRVRAATDFSVFKYGWSNYTSLNLDQVAGVIARSVWSPIQWDLGHRHSDRFKLSQVCALDFDEGYTIDEAMKWCRERKLAFVIGTTKSHNIAKGDKQPCERFRLLLFWDKPIKNPDTYEYNVKLMMKELPKADKQCKDLARLFWPCKSVIIVEEGERLKAQPRPSNVLTKKQIIEKHNEKLRVHKAVGVIPKKLRMKLKGHYVTGERNNTIYGVACDLHKLGFTNEAIFDLVMENSTLAEIGAKEIKATIESAQKN